MTDYPDKDLIENIEYNLDLNLEDKERKRILQTVSASHLTFDSSADLHFRDTYGEPMQDISGVSHPDLIFFC